MSAARYGFFELWDDLQSHYYAFTSRNTVCASSQKDEESYELARTALEDMITVGRQAQAITLWNPAQKIELSIKAKDSLSRHFGPDQTPPVDGEKSLAFLKDVMLPHIERSLKVEVDPISAWLGTFVGVDFAAERLRAGELIEKYKCIIAEERAKQVTGEQFRFFRSSDADTLSASTQNTNNCQPRN